ncbi:hypothetical protein MTBBW1_1270037 [Desulfamplus magnetovallimortis]|uniref:Uncharacterized protein n=1 Tax=Desulfamplus magnetovallimortis TaxID=1246637 RepID=A0A1W1H6U3_9BACT|nr:YfiR family protein [Desulfamplus magnetovallimortis]SLM28187.1 hypothetical protein MTBBW1_1270037 [Desulfamplus magnetovallimortis]
MIKKISSVGDKRETFVNDKKMSSVGDNKENLADKNIATTVDNNIVPPIVDAQIVIVTRSEKKKAQALLDMIAGHPILTVGDFPGFAEQGGILNFYPKPNNRIGFEINVDAKNRSGIKISSHLLRLARIVSDR